MDDSSPTMQPHQQLIDGATYYLQALQTTIAPLTDKTYTQPSLSLPAAPSANTYSRRDHQTESRVCSGVAAIQGCVDKLHAFKGGLEGNLEARFMSTVGRELWFCTHHMVHHNAVITMLMHEFGHKVPDEFAYAPSTKVHQSKPQ
ncbi:hypothetical protein BX661DRAFT_183239 [Kickxella alabastrina]|uniref:uncharacterized protein n=1 Tax=Kickxella alabastrina TaxID=61397 RepID=UPI00221E89ED|nr:uncharacterized protein BX661DRAFT_183239 [Kickxella alabastrina]KAI7826670.1 hypothetical protein BX661DRAFT_183239 [Kickxella alabastrina]